MGSQERDAFTARGYESISHRTNIAPTFREEIGEFRKRLSYKYFQFECLFGEAAAAPRMFLKLCSLQTYLSPKQIGCRIRSGQPGTADLGLGSFTR